MGTLQTAFPKNRSLDNGGNGREAEAVFVTAEGFRPASARF